MATTLQKKLAHIMSEFVPQYMRWMSQHVPSNVSETSVRLLVVLHTRTNATMRELSHCVGVTPAHITNLVDELEQQKLVQRLPHPTDRRSTLIGLTSKGRDVALVAWEQFLADAGLVFRFLTVDEQQALFDLLSKLAPSLQTHLAEGKKKE